MSATPPPFLLFVRNNPACRGLLETIEAKIDEVISNSDIRIRIFNIERSDNAVNHKQFGVVKVPSLVNYHGDVIIGVTRIVEFLDYAYANGDTDMVSSPQDQQLSGSQAAMLTNSNNVGQFFNKPSISSNDDDKNLQYGKSTDLDETSIKTDEFIRDRIMEEMNSGMQDGTEDSKAKESRDARAQAETAHRQKKAESRGGSSSRHGVSRLT